MDLRSWFTAVTSGSFEEVNALIAAGADLNAKNDKGQTALHVAVLKSGLFDTEAPLVSALLTAGADKDARLEGGWTPLHLAIANGRVAAVSALLAHQAQMDVWDERGRTPLHLAAEKRDPKMPQIIKELLAAGADKNVRTKGVGATPLHVAAFFGLPAIVEILLEAGADQSAKNKYGSTPLDMAKEELRKGHEGCAAVVELLAAAAEKKKTSFLKRIFGARESAITEVSAPSSAPSGASEPMNVAPAFAEMASRGPADREIGIAEWPSVYEALSSKLIASGIAAREVVDLVNERLIGVCPMCRVLSPGKGLQMINLMRETSVFIGAPPDAYRFLKGHCRTESCPSKKVLIFWKPDEDRDAIARLGAMGIVVRPRLATAPPVSFAEWASRKDVAELLRSKGVDVDPTARAVNLDRWKSSGEPEAWVRKHLDGWNHNDWLGLLGSLRDSQYWPMDEAAVGQHIEVLRERKILAEMKALKFDEDVRLGWEESKREGWNSNKTMTRDELAEHVGRVALYVKQRVQTKYGLTDEQFDRLYLKVLETD